MLGTGVSGSTRWMLSMLCVALTAFVTVATAEPEGGPSGWDGTNWLVVSTAYVDENGQEKEAIERLRSDGSGRKVIVNGKWLAYPAVSSQDGRVAFFEWPKLYSVNLKGEERRELTPMKKEHYQPRWSPDGKELVFSTDRDQNLEVYRMSADGSFPRNLTWRPMTSEVDPSWSPDASQIVLSSNRTGGKFELFLMDRNGYLSRQLTFGLGNAVLPAWSPDGKRIAFASDHEGGSQIYTIQPDGSGLKRWTTEGQWNGQPAWDVSGRFLAFVSDRDGGSDLIILDTETGDSRNITKGSGREFAFPSWVPTGGSAGVGERAGVVKPPALLENLPRPRVLVTQEDLPALRERFQTPPYDEAWRAFLNRCDLLLQPDSKPRRMVAEKTASVRNQWKDVQMPVEAARNLGFASLITEDPKYAEVGVKILLQLAEQIRDRYPLGYIDWRTMLDTDTFPAAFDWLYSTMTEEQRDLVGGVLKRSAELKFQSLQYDTAGFASMAVNSSLASNFSWIRPSYLGMEAWALAGEPGWEPRWLDTALYLVNRVNRQWFDAQGGPLDGFDYLKWTGNFAAPLIVTAVRFGIAPEMTETNLRNFPRWLAMVAGDGGAVMPRLDDGDGGTMNFPLGFLDLFADDPVVRYLWAASPQSLKPKPEVASLLWWRPAVKSEDPSRHLPRAEIFPHPGHAVFRAGFGPLDPVMTFSAPAHSGHQHPSGGSFQLRGYGAEFVTAAGYGVRGVQGLNHVLVNGRGRGDRISSVDAPLRDFRETSWVSGAVAELTEVFRRKGVGYGEAVRATIHYPLKRAVRIAAMVHDPKSEIPAYFVLYDDLDRNGEENNYRFQMLGEICETVGIEDHKVTLRPWVPEKGAAFRSGAVVTLDVEAPADGNYFLWMYLSGRGTLGWEVNGQKGEMLLSEVKGRANLWQWSQGFEASSDKPLALPLKKGSNAITFRRTKGELRAARILLTAEPSQQPANGWAERPSNAIEVNLESNGEVFAESTRPALGAAAEFYFLNPEPITLGAHWFTFQNRFKAQVRLPQITADRQVVNPRFLTLIYPRQEGMPQPNITRSRVGEPLMARIEWPGGIDWIVSAPDKQWVDKEGIRTDARLAIIRQTPNGSVRGEIFDGTTLILNGKALVSPAP